jgi:hypothetical protein
LYRTNKLHVYLPFSGCNKNVLVLIPIFGIAIRIGEEE